MLKLTESGDQGGMDRMRKNYKLFGLAVLNNLKPGSGLLHCCSDSGNGGEAVVRLSLLPSSSDDQFSQSCAVQYATLRR
jgi:hypothetical protein